MRTEVKTLAEVKPHALKKKEKEREKERKKTVLKPLEHSVPYRDRVNKSYRTVSHRYSLCHDINTLCGRLMF